MKKNRLAETLTAIRASTAKWFDLENDRLVRGLIERGAGSGALKAGDRIPEFMLPTADGRLMRSSDLVGDPLVINFYRGMWCPYCSAELNALANAAPDLRAAGANVVAITPETGGAALKTKKERDLEFEILCDVDNGVAMEFGLMFRIPDDIQPHYAKFNVKLPLIYGNDSWMLPIPATYVVAKDGTIAFAYVNPEYRARFDPDDLLGIVTDLK